MDKTSKQPDSKALLAKIRSLVAKHMADVKDKIDVDEPAVPRRDDQGNDITGDAKSVGDYHRARRSTKRQFMKVHSEAISDTQDEPEPDKPTSAKAKTAKAKSAESKPMAGAKGKGSPQIELSPPEATYGNNSLFKDMQRENVFDMYVAYLREFVDERGDFGGGPSKKDRQTQHFVRWHMERVKKSSEKYTSHGRAYNDYKKHAKNHNIEPMPHYSDIYGSDENLDHDFDMHMRRSGHTPTTKSWQVEIGNNK